MTLNFILRNCFLPIGKGQSQKEALSQGSYLVIIAVSEKLLPCGIFQKASLRGERELREEVGSRRFLCRGLQGKAAQSETRLRCQDPRQAISERGDPPRTTPTEGCTKKRAVPSLSKGQGETYQGS